MVRHTVRRNDDDDLPRNDAMSSWLPSSVCPNRSGLLALAQHAAADGRRAGTAHAEQGKRHRDRTAVRATARRDGNQYPQSGGSCPSSVRSCQSCQLGGANSSNAMPSGPDSRIYHCRTALGCAWRPHPMGRPRP